MKLRFLSGIAIGLAIAGSVSADENVREVQEKLRDGGFYWGEIDGAYSSELSAALTLYQTHNKLPATGQLDADTSDALDATPAVTKNKAAPERSSESSRRSRNREEQTDARERVSPSTERSDPEVGPIQGGAVTAPVPPQSATQSGDSPSLPDSANPVSAPPATLSSSSGDGDISTEQLRDYVGAFVQAGLDPQVESEADFFADRVKYYDQGVIDREQVRNDLQGYAARWPERHFWFMGNITIEPQRRKQVRVTFPLRYELRNGATYSSGTINKTLVLEQAGGHLQIVAVSERTAE